MVSHGGRFLLQHSTALRQTLERKPIVSQRERWIVYPLLFFSFALAIRDQWPPSKPRPDFNVVTCRQLIVKDADGGVAVDIHAQPLGDAAGSGVVTVYSPSQQVGTAKLPAVHVGVKQHGNTGQVYGLVETFGPLGTPATQLTSDLAGGSIRTYDPIGRGVFIGPVRRRVPPQTTPDESEEDPRKAKVRPPVPEVEDAEAATTTALLRTSSLP